MHYVVGELGKGSGSVSKKIELGRKLTAMGLAVWAWDIGEHWDWELGHLFPKT